MQVLTKSVGAGPRLSTFTSRSRNPWGFVRLHGGESVSFQLILLGYHVAVVQDLVLIFHEIGKNARASALSAASLPMSPADSARAKIDALLRATTVDP